MLAILTAFLPLAVKIFPLVISMFTKDQEEKRRALEQFQKWVEQHKSDGLQSTSLRAQAQQQKADLQAIAEARDASTATAPAAAPATAKSPVPAVPQAKS